MRRFIVMGLITLSIAALSACGSSTRPSDALPVGCQDSSACGSTSQTSGAVQAERMRENFERQQQMQRNLRQRLREHAGMSVESSGIGSFPSDNGVAQ